MQKYFFTDVETSHTSKCPQYNLEFADQGYEVSPLLFGGNLEHSRSAISGGLSAQMLRNRKFVGMPNSFRGNAAEWFIIGDKTFGMLGSDQTGRKSSRMTAVESYTRHSSLGYHMKRRYECNPQMVQNLGNGSAGIGQHELYVKKDCKYEFRIVLHTDMPVKLKIAITSRGGSEVYASETVVVEGEEWQTYTAALKSVCTDEDADLRITFCEPARLVIGAVSLMPAENFRGMRKDVITLLKEMNIKFLRWPGGNFAGEYNWLDGLLPCDMRAPLESYILYLTQPHTMGYDYSEIDTDDFIALCREIGAEPSITINITWNTPEENAAWVEYCNGGADTRFGKMRIERGFAEPYNVKYWSLGNEAGYGHMEGDNTPEGYCQIAAANAAAMLKTDSDLVLCSSGCHPDSKWALEANNKLAGVASMTALHNYVDFPSYANGVDRKQEYIECLTGVEECRDKIHMLRSYLLSEVDIAFDEWNCWYSWYRPGDVFAGIFAARMFHMFMYEQKNSGVVLSAVYQPVSEGCMTVLPDHAEITPMGQIFEVMTQHSGGRVLHISDAAAVTYKDSTVTVTLINDSYDTEKTFRFEESGVLAEGIQYYSDTVGPYTEFSVQSVSSICDNGFCGITVPPKSVTLLRFAKMA